MSDVIGFIGFVLILLFFVIAYVYMLISSYQYGLFTGIFSTIGLVGFACIPISVVLNSLGK